MAGKPGTGLNEPGFIAEAQGGAPSFSRPPEFRAFGLLRSTRWQPSTGGNKARPTNYDNRLAEMTEAAPRQDSGGR